MYGRKTTPKASRLSNLKLRIKKAYQTVAKSKAFGRMTTIGQYVKTGTMMLFRLGNSVIVFTLSLPLMAYVSATSLVLKAFELVAGTFNKTAQV